MKILKLPNGKYGRFVGGVLYDISSSSQPDEPVKTSDNENLTYKKNPTTIDQDYEKLELEDILNNRVVVFDTNISEMIRKTNNSEMAYKLSKLVSKIWNKAELSYLSKLKELAKLSEKGDVKFVDISDYKVIKNKTEDFVIIDDTIYYVE